MTLLVIYDRSAMKSLEIREFSDSERDDALREVCRERDQLQRRVRELEAERDHHEARERELEARGFERPGPSAYTCGDALGLRRLPEVEPQASAPEARAPRPDCPACHGHGHYAKAWVMGPDVECGCWRRLPEVEPQFPAPEVDNEELP